MLRDESVSQVLTFALTQIKEKLGSKGTLVCSQYLNAIHSYIHQLSKEPSDYHPILLKKLVACMESIIKKVDQEGVRLEIEMGGVAHYSDYFFGLLKEYEYKKLLSDEIKRLLQQLKYYSITAIPA